MSGPAAPPGGPSGGRVEHRLEPVAADAGAFLVRLVRLDPGALVRLRPAGRGRVDLWARLPWEVIVTRRLTSGPSGDVTVAAAELLRALSTGDPLLPRVRDAQWRWPLPPPRARVVEQVPGTELRRIGAAAAATLREAAGGAASGRTMGERVVRDTLLDHVPIVVSAGQERFEVSQRLVQGILRMGFLGSEAEAGTTRDVVPVVVAGAWVGLAGRYGSAWRQQRAALGIRPTGPARAG